MRAFTSLAILGAAFVAGAAAAQKPPGIAINAQAAADLGLWARHDNAGITEIASLPAGTIFTTTAVGPSCGCWPAEGARVQYWVGEELDGYTYEGTEFVRAPAGDTAETGVHDNVIRMSAQTCIPAMVEIKIDSLTDAEHYHAWAAVDVVGYGTIHHDFVTEHTQATVPVMLDRLGLEIRVGTHLHVDNKTAPTFQGLIDLDIKVTVRIPGGAYTTGGSGCAGSNGVPDLQPMAGQVPVVGWPFGVEVKNLPLDPGKAAFGMVSATNLVPPLDLGMIGMPGCQLYVYTPVALPLVKYAGSAQWIISIPQELSLVSAKFYQQVFALDEPFVNPLAAVVSNYGEGTLGVVPVFLP